MTKIENILILVADSHESRRRQMADLLRAEGYQVIQAIDGGTAIKVVEEQKPDITIFAYDMRPRSGFDLARHIRVEGDDTALIMIADNPTTDLLVEAGKYDIKQTLSTPVDPVRLAETVRRVLRAVHKLDRIPLRAVAQGPAELMRRAIVLAQQNGRSAMGGPFGAVVADADGRIVGEGVNSVTTRCDPTAHAEVIAIRRATEALNTTDLSGCAIYCSSEPTMLGQALIISTGLSKVYYGLRHEEVGATRMNEDGILGEINKPAAARIVPHEQLQHDEALAMFTDWQAQKDRVAD